MDYFRIKQDSRIVNAVQLSKEGKDLITELLKSDVIPKFDDILPLYIDDRDEVNYLDFLEYEVPLVSDEVKNILEKYDSTLFFKPVYLLNKGETEQTLYWLHIPDLIDCLSSQSEINKDGTIRKLVIDPNQVGTAKLFQIAGILENVYVIRLDVAESLLRRDVSGFCLQRVEQA